jgi:hypothetical protein
MLEAAGAPAGATIRVVARDGFDAVAYYLLVDEIAALRPAAVVLTANLQSFTDSWFRQTRMKHPQLAAFVRPTRVWRARRCRSSKPASTTRALLLDPAWRADRRERLAGEGSTATAPASAKRL